MTSSSPLTLSTFQRPNSYCISQYFYTVLNNTTLTKHIMYYQYISVSLSLAKMYLYSQLISWLFDKCIAIQDKIHVCNIYTTRNWYESLKETNVFLLANWKTIYSSLQTMKKKKIYQYLVQYKSNGQSVLSFWTKSVITSTVTAHIYLCSYMTEINECMFTYKRLRYFRNFLLYFSL